MFITDTASKREMKPARRNLFAATFLFIIIFLVYSNTLDATWHFDDEPNITANSNIHMSELSWAALKKSFFSLKEHPTSLYRPVSCASFALNYYFGGLDVTGYHLVNIGIHFLSAFFLFLFTFHTLNLPRFNGKYRSSAYFIALLSSVLWAVNPVQTQAVTYIVQRMASMAGMFYIWSMYHYLKARLSGAGKWRNLHYILCALTFAMAFGSKQNAIMVPIAIALYELIVFQGNLNTNLGKKLKQFSLVGLIVLSAGLLFQYLYLSSELNFIRSYEERPFNIAQRLLTEPRVLLFYLSLLFYPVSGRLNISHWTEISTSLFSPPTTIISIVLIALLLIAALRLAGKYPLLSFSIIFFFLNHLVESTVFALELLYEHRNYIPSMFLFLPPAAGFHFALEQYRRNRAMGVVLSSFAILLIMLLGVSTAIRNDAWSNERTIWSDALSKAPNLHRNYHNLAQFYHLSNFPAAALPLYMKALEQPAYHRKTEKGITYYNLGKAYGDLGNHKEAEIYYKKAIEIAPTYSPAYNNLATTLFHLGKVDSARDYLKAALQLSPNAPEGHLNLGLYYLKDNAPAKALSHLRVAEKSGYNHPQQHLYLAIALKQLGQFGMASKYLNRVLSITDNDLRAYLHLADTYLMAGHEDKAEAELLNFINKIKDKSVLREFIEQLTGNDKEHSLFFSPDLGAFLGEVCKKQSDRFSEWEKALLK